MKQIETGIYIEKNYLGVTLGAIALRGGTLLIDAPLHPDDGRIWLSSVRGLGGGASRMVVCLDSHPDRTIGLRALDTSVLSHIVTAVLLEELPAIFKGQNLKSGAEWELSDGLNGIRWARPSLTFSEQLLVEWGEEQVIVEYHPGPAPGASWVVIPEANVVFIGDAVVRNQPPFLAEAELPAWIEALDLLISSDYRNYLFVSGRGGLVDKTEIREQRRFLKDVHARLENLAERESEPRQTEKMVKNLLSKFDFKRDMQSLYTNRLTYGLHHYYARHYYPHVENEESN